MHLTYKLTSYGIFLHEVVKRVLSHFENQSTCYCVFDRADLIVVAGVGQHVYEIAVISCADMQSEEKQSCEENFYSTFHRPIMTCSTTHETIVV